MDEDLKAIDAVMQGDRERFGELVERHERQVFAIAWSRLGDAALAEEASQESFIRAFRYLGALRDPSRFSGWLGRITRNVATAIGRREKKELNTRSRWQTEVPREEMPEESENESYATADDIESALGDLPDDYREALVLFYLRGESIIEAAATVGVEDGTFRTRLHRARGKLRLAIEKRTEDSLRRLRPSKRLAPLVLAAIPAAPMGASAAGVVGAVGGKMVGSVAKGFTGLLFLPLLQIPLTLGMWWFVYGPAVKSFRDAEDRRAKLLKQTLGRNMIAFLVMLIGMMAVAGADGFGFGYDSFLKIMTVVLVPILVIDTVRRLRVMRRNRARAMIAIGWVWVIVVGCMAFLDAPAWTFWCGALVGGLLQLYAADELNHVRMDHHLCLRQALGKTGRPRVDSEPPKLDLSDAQLKAFGYWMGDLKHVVDRQISADGMTLFSVPVRPNLLTAMCFWRRPSNTTLFLNRQGRTHIHLSRYDHDEVLKSVPDAPDYERLAHGTGQVVQAAADAFFQGDQPAAEGLLAPESFDEVFHRKPFGTWQFRGMQWLIVVISLFLIGMGVTGNYGKKERWQRTHLPELGREEVTEQFGKDIPKLATVPPNQAGHEWMAMHLWHEGIHQFKTGDLDDHSLALLRDRARAEIEGIGSTRKHWIRGGSIVFSDTAYKACFTGLFSEREVSELGFTERSVRDAFSAMPRDRLNRFLTPRGIRSRNVDWEYFRLDSHYWQHLLLLKQFSCFDLVDREPIIRAIVERQVGEGFDLQRTPVRPGMEIENLHGQFFSGDYDFQFNWRCIRTLYVIDALDQINQEAFVEAILKHHQGAGRFGLKTRRRGRPTRPPAWGRFEGDYKETFCVLDCLLMLGAANRISDLDAWAFRVSSKHFSTERKRFYHDEMISFLMNERLQKILTFAQLPETLFPLRAPIIKPR